MNGNELFVPDFAAATGLLGHLNSDELKELLNDDSKLDNMIKDLQQVKNIECEKEMILASNRSIAEYNLSIKPILEDGRLNILQLYSRANDLKSNVTSKRAKLENKNTQKPLDTVLAILQAKTAEVEEKSEQHVEEMLSGQLNIEDFLKQFISTKSNAHVLHTKVDKMGEILKRPELKQPAVPLRNRKGSRPAPLPPSEFTKPPLVVKLPDKKHSNDSRVIVPTRAAPKPPVKIRSPVNKVTSAFNSLDIYSSPTVPLPMIPVPKKC